jgi:hypothetical protein
MAKPQPQQPVNRFKNFGVWLARHKVLSIFITLLLAIVVFFAVTIIQWNLSVRAERADFNAAADKLDSIRTSINDERLSKQVERGCDYSSNGAVFATRFLGCESYLDITAESISKADAESITESIRKIVVRKGISLRMNTYTHDVSNLVVYDFNIEKLSCVLSSTYYDKSVSSSSRYEQSPMSGDALLISIGCSGPAKAEYFPVTHD